MESAESSNVIVWSCNRYKYCKMLVETYEETLMQNGNIKWHLTVVPSLVGISTIEKDTSLDNIDYRSFVFYLDVCGGMVTRDVIAVIISRKKALRKGVLKFNPTKLTNIIGVISNKFDDYDLDIIFKFLDVVENFQPIPQIIEMANEKERKYVYAETEINLTDELVKDFEAMLKDEDVADLTIKCKGETTNLKVHKCVLRARSPVFKVMLSSPMQESSSDIVVTDDIDGEILQSMVRFMYCGKVKIMSMNMATGLLYAAEKYQIESLKTGIIQHFKTILCETNAIEILRLADIYDEQFKAKMIQYVSENFNNLKHTKQWKELKSEKPTLALEVYTYNDLK